MIVYLARDIPQFVMYCVNGKPRSSLFIESTDSMIIFKAIILTNEPQPAGPMFARCALTARAREKIYI